MTNEQSMKCYKCNHTLDLTEGEKILRHEECGHCQASLYCCKMCVHYDTHSYNECREPLAERIVDKEKANFCSYFKISDQGAGQGKSKDDLLAAADALFKK